jgi:hypothetical protein
MVVDRKKAVRAAWEAANRGRIRDRGRELYKKRREIECESAREARKRDPSSAREAEARWRAKNPEKVRAKCAAYRKKNADKIRERARERYQTEPAFAIKKRLRARLTACIDRGMAEQKWAATMDLVGCSIEDLMTHLAAGFADGMSWENRSEWHIDHIVPCAAFDLNDPEQQRACFHFTNLRPLWREDNMKKGCKLMPAG